MWSALFEYMHLQLGVTTLYAGDYNNCILECSKYFAHIHLPRFPCHTAGHKPCFLLSTFGFCFCHWQTSWTRVRLLCMWLGPRSGGILLQSGMKLAWPGGQWCRMWCSNIATRNEVARVWHCLLKPCLVCGDMAGGTTHRQHRVAEIT